MDVKELQRRLGAVPDGVFGPKSREALFAVLTNRMAPALTDADVARAALALGVTEKHIRAVTAVEAPRGAFDDAGRPSILFERHVFSRRSGGRFDAGHPDLSGPPYGPGGYGPYSAQYGKLAAACALDPGAAFQACSWGAFQILGENAVACGYDSAFDMAVALTIGVAAHLECFVRFVKAEGLADALRACKADAPLSCVPFVERYNGPGYAKFGYHVKLAGALR